VAVGNPYGRGLYGKGPYARYDATRPYGMGAYGTGPYARWGANTFDVAGATSIAFDAQAAAPRLTHMLHAATGISFDVWSDGMAVTIHPWALTEIVLTTTAPLELTWDAWAPCGPGGWQSPAGCEEGAWGLPAGCSAGTWELTRLTT
jgi:hypothetical protein